MTNLKTFLDLIARDDYVVLDTETTGLKFGEICQIAIVESTGDVLFDELVKTHDPIPADATAIHGITDRMVVDSPTWPDIGDEIWRILAERDVVVYNAVYDRKMLHQTAERWGLLRVDWKTVATWHCAMEAAAEWNGDWNEYHSSYRWQPLTKIASGFGIPTNGAHNALTDCQMTLEVCRALLIERENQHEG